MSRVLMFRDITRWDTFSHPNPMLALSAIDKAYQWFYGDLQPPGCTRRIQSLLIRHRCGPDQSRRLTELSLWKSYDIFLSIDVQLVVMILLCSPAILLVALTIVSTALSGLFDGGELSPQSPQLQPRSGGRQYRPFREYSSENFFQEFTFFNVRTASNLRNTWLTVFRIPTRQVVLFGMPSFPGRVRPSGMTSV